MALLRPGRALAAALAVLTGGCDFVRPPTYVPGDPEQVMVHAVLRAGDDSAAVMVTRVGTSDGSAGVPGAQVRIVGAAGTAVLAQADGGFAACMPFVPNSSELPDSEGGCYRGAVPGGVRAGAEYRLEVDVPDGTRVRGRTVVPDPPLPLSPADGLRLEGTDSGFSLEADTTTQVRWTSEYAVGLSTRADRVFGSAEGVVCGVTMDADNRNPYDPRADSITVRFGVAACYADETLAPRPDSVQAELLLTAYDPAYVAYIRDHPNGIPLEQAHGVEGAYGVFAGTASTTRGITLVRRPSQPVP